MVGKSYYDGWDAEVDQARIDKQKRPVLKGITRQRERPRNQRQEVFFRFQGVSGDGSGRQNWGMDGRLENEPQAKRR
jgi:hypothetical protein